ncbi:glycine betaine ABC transporter substrate-binding protein [Methanolobus bombayensis]|uniref:glycine betaine ABC transporter substrate-binding protein n=1 Tax=Methanolobus bombayensis TaxID=38023 RepID=UPI001AE411D3|nr:glycine betaine ABC transporter substrate-binding protein [Methanolobus bombayensis]MBP1910436.1 glycine betaine/proline transport system substrate-binding protein [Methanolobus bombayensis]
MKNNFLKILACLIIACALISSGCTSEDNASDTESTAEDTTQEAVKIGIVQWDDSRATGSVFTQILDESEYEYETVEGADLGALYQATAQGDIDVLIQAWLPATQAPYWDKYNDSLVQAQVIASGAKCGLVVPEYVPINTIEELKGNASKFDGQISGIEPGAGIMQNTESCIVDYELEEYELYSSSTVGMVTELQDKINNEEWVVVTLWRPHWSFARIDGLKFLEDSKGEYGGSDDLIILTRTGFEEDNPEFYQIIQNFEMDLSDIESIMIAIDEGQTPDEAAAAWLAENPEKINEVIGTQE